MKFFRKREETQPTPVPAEQPASPPLTVEVGGRAIPVPEGKEELFAWAADRSNYSGQFFLSKYVDAKDSADRWQGHSQVSQKFQEEADNWLEALQSIQPVI